MRMDGNRTIKVNFSLYAPEASALAGCVRELRQGGVKAREGTVIRAILHAATAKDMVARCATLTTDLALNGGPAWGSSTGSSTADVLVTDVRKMDAVIDQLARANITATRSFILRALLLSAPAGRPLVALVTGFLEKFPYKPRGLSKLRLEAKARRHG